jgi:release factor glutamine methyltransferase
VIAAGDTIASALNAITRALAGAGIEGASRDARWMLAACLDSDPTLAIRSPAHPLSAEQALVLSAAVVRRIAREPVSRILGEREFYGRVFSLTPAVLDPRPDTEILIEVALDLVRPVHPDGRGLTILDVGTGSGAILVTLLAELPAATGLGIDISPGALECAQANARALGVAARAEFQTHDAREGLPDGYALIVSNPPYIRRGDIAGLDPEVSVYDPQLALDGGADGLDFYRCIARSVAGQKNVSHSPQWLVLEVGADQSSQVADITREKGLVSDGQPVSAHPDLGGHIRCVSCRTR